MINGIRMLSIWILLVERRNKIMGQQNKTKKVKKIRNGNIIAVIFRTRTQIDGQPIVRHTTQIYKRYRKKNGTLHKTDRYFLEDLGRFMDVTLKAYKYIYNKERLHAGESGSWMIQKT